MKILFVSNYFGYKSGFNKAAIDILYSILNTENEICVLSKNTKIKLNSKVNENFNWVTAPWQLKFERPVKLRNTIKFIFRSFQDVFRGNYLNRIKKFDPDLVIINSYSHNLIFGLNFFWNKKTVFINHGSVESCDFHPKEFNLENTRLLLSKFEYLIFVSSEVKKQWLKFEELSNKKTFYIPNCADETSITKLMRKEKVEVAQNLGFETRKFNVVCVANVSYGKGHDIIFKIIDKYYNKMGDFVFHFIGSKSNTFAKKLIDEAMKSEMKEHVFFHGVKSNAIDYIYAADLFILPSRAEAFPLSILEAMVLKTPIIASSVNGIVEMITDKKDGLLFPKNNSELLWENLYWIFNNQEMGMELAVNAYEKYWKEFSKEKQIERYKRVLNEIKHNYEKTYSGS